MYGDKVPVSQNAHRLSLCATFKGGKRLNKSDKSCSAVRNLRSVLDVVFGDMRFEIGDVPARDTLGKKSGCDVFHGVCSCLCCDQKGEGRGAAKSAKPS